MKGLQNNNASDRFLFYAIVFLIIGAVFLLGFDKGDMVLFLNENRKPFLNTFFKYLTHLGDGLIIIPLFIISLFLKYRYALLTLIASIFVLLFSQGLKRTIFSEYLRPTAFFGADVNWNFIEGVKVHSHFSFPSGHTITAFMVFYALAIMLNNRFASWVLFAIALLTGVSRIYLLQHFFVDVYFGSILGLLAVILANSINERIFKGSKFLDRSLLKYE